jgi:hypothetical protein
LEILENIPLELDLGEVARKLHMPKEKIGEDLKGLVALARSLARPRAAYKVCYVDERAEDSVVVDGVRLTSRVLRKNLDAVGRVFAYVVTIGEELEERAASLQDMLEKYALDTIGNVALVGARKVLEAHLRSRYALEAMSFMSPGSLEDWPIEEQRRLFSLLGDVEASAGVTLTESLLMLPRKSVSGLYFPTEVRFFNCQLCDRERCEGRKAKYSEKLAREYGLRK